jgi:hypothetical protein
MNIFAVFSLPSPKGKGSGKFISLYGRIFYVRQALLRARLVLLNPLNSLESTRYLVGYVVVPNILNHDMPYGQEGRIACHENHELTCDFNGENVSKCGVTDRFFNVNMASTSVL